jgi:octaprenyl-diphosphate synthase
MSVLVSQDNTLRQRIDDDLVQVRRLFSRELNSDLDCVNELAEHTQRYHGKMLRPMLVLVTAMALNPGRPGTEPKHLVAAAVVEMVHMATLVHDDILDEARMRRGGATINHLRGNEAAVMLGDYLISHAYHLCTSLGSPTISRMIAHATNTVCEGELLQLANRQNLELDEQTYLQIITRKTASLCGACCRVAAELSGCPGGQADAVFAYGQTLGIAFQIIDDVLDLTGDQTTVGKTLGLDLAKGKLTLPLIHAVSASKGPNREELVGLLRGQADPVLSDQDTAAGARRIREILADGKSLEYARDRAVKLIDRAQTGLIEHLEDTPARACLLRMADTVLTRRQ